MAKKIEIFENTLLKLLVRRGSDADRQNTILAEGELGYTTDTKRLFVGDGSTPGGIAIGGGIESSGGGRFIASVTDVTTRNNAVMGDMAYDTDNKKLYTLGGGSPSIQSNWVEIGGVYTKGNDTIVISSTNQIRVNSLSAGNISSDVLGSGLEIDENNRVRISTSSITTDAIAPYSTSHLQLPGDISINGINYNWPAGGLAEDQYLKIDVSGNLSWSPAFTPTTVYHAGTAGQIPVGSIMPFISSSNAPYGWLLCNGQSVLGTDYKELSSVIGTTYGGDNTNFNVPNFIKKTIYGVQSNPSTSTTFSIASGTNSVLSAAGALYIIKAKPDKIIDVSLSVTYPLCATLNGVEQLNSFSPLSGSVVIGFDEVLSSDSETLEFKRGVIANKYGQIIGEADQYDAGDLLTVSNTQIVNNESHIKFLTSPVEIASIGANTTFTSNISVYPEIKSLIFTGENLTGYDSTIYSITSAAKSVIIDSWASSRSTGTIAESLLAGASDIQYINTSTPDSKALGAGEYLINYSYVTGSGNNSCTSNQVMIPLSSNNEGVLTFGLRGTTDTITNNCFIRIIGFTE